MTRLGQTVVVLLVLLAVAPTGASAASCVQDEALRPAPGAATVLNAIEGGLTLSKGNVNTRTASVIEGPPIPKVGRSSTAAIIQPIDTNYSTAKFTVVGSAHVIEPGTSVQVKLCTDGGTWFDAGTYTGKVNVFGPNLQMQTYDYTVTARWSWFIPAFLLLVGGVAYVALMFANNRLPAVALTHTTNQIVFGVATLTGFGLAYITVYQADATWGDSPLSDLTALFTGGLTVAGVVTAAMAGLIGEDKPPPPPPPTAPPSNGEAARSMETVKLRTG